MLHALQLFRELFYAGQLFLTLRDLAAQRLRLLREQQFDYEPRLLLG